jgi:hypothetical protein
MANIITPSKIKTVIIEEMTPKGEGVGGRGGKVSMLYFEYILRIPIHLIPSILL